MNTFLKNNRGSSLVSVLVIGSILITSGVYVLKQTQDSQRRKTQLEYKIQENQIEDTLVNTLSNKNNCTKIFSGYASSDGTLLNFKQLDSLKDKIRSETRSESVFESLNYEVESVDINSPLIANNAKNIESASAKITIKVIRDSKVMALLKKSSHSVNKVVIPINFEFDVDKTNNTRKLMSCFATSADSEFVNVAKNNCEASGGSLDAHQKCVFKINELEWNGSGKKFEVKSRNDLDLQDMLCKIDNSITQKLRTASTDDLYSEFCPTVQFNGCIVNGVKYKNGDQITYSYQGKKGSVYDRANTLQYQSSYLRYLKYSTDFELAGLDFSKTKLGGNYIKQHSTSKSGIATGVAASLIVGNMLSGGFLLAPLLIIKMEEWICGNKYKGNVVSYCVDGKEVMSHVYVERRRMKKFKCKWKSDGVVQADTDGTIIRNLKNMLDGSVTSVTPTYSNVEINEEDDQKIKDLSELKKKFSEALSNYAKISSIDTFYEEIQDFRSESSEKLTAEDSKDISPEILDYEKFVDQEIKKLEIKNWDNLRNSIKNYSYSAQTYTAIVSFVSGKQNSIDYSSSRLVVATPSETSTLAKKDLLELQKNIVSIVESRVNGATTLSDLESYGNPQELKGSFSSELSSRINNIIAKYKGQKEALKPKVASGT